MEGIAEYKCPACGGAVKFDSASQKLKCPYCDTEFDIGEILRAKEDDAKERKDSISWDSSGAEWDESETQGILVYHCESCGGEIVAEETTGASNCPYCGNPVVMKEKFSGDLRPDLIIPFKLDKKAAVKALRQHIFSKKFVPKLFKDENHIDEIKGVYIPHWLFSCDADAELSFSAEKLRVWTDSKYEYTETSYYRLYRSGVLGFDNVPVDGSSTVPNALTESIEPFELSAAEGFSPAYLAGFLADRYDVGIDECIPRANVRIRESTRRRFEETVRGYSSVVNTGMSLNIENGSCKYALLPAYILHTSCEGRNYLFAMNGQTGKIVGDLPLDKKKFGICLGLGGPLIGALLSLLYFLFSNYM